ncbi:hypothetical protein DFH09DRAFT_926564, partial [Mycena vulgaris]
SANIEVIISAGSIGPAILMLMHSGFGNSSTLSFLGIKGLHNFPDVGQNLTDYTLVIWLANSIDTFQTVATPISLSSLSSRTGQVRLSSRR